MIKKLKIFLLLIISTLFILSCEISPTIDLSNVPSNLRRTLLINYQVNIGTVTFSTSEINVVLGSQSSSFGTYALEFDSSTLISNGYSLTTAYLNTTIPVFTLICTKQNSPTLKYVFTLYSEDIWVAKFVDNVLASSYATVLTWDAGD